jgi:hypothetical protein
LFVVDWAAHSEAGLFGPRRTNGACSVHAGPTEPVRSTPDQRCRFGPPGPTDRLGPGSPVHASYPGSDGVVHGRAGAARPDGDAPRSANADQSGRLVRPKRRVVARDGAALAQRGLAMTRLSRPRNVSRPTDRPSLRRCVRPVPAATGTVPVGEAAAVRPRFSARWCLVSSSRRPGRQEISRSVQGVKRHVLCGGLCVARLLRRRVNRIGPGVGARWSSGA